MSGAVAALVDLDDMDVLQFVIHPLAQHLICAMQAELLDGPYRTFGKTDGSEEQFNLVFPKTYGSDRRKPVTTRFQDFCEAVYWPLINALLFGRQGWEQVRPHLTAFKVNTLQISAKEFYYGQDIYHFHLDHKIGRLEPKDQMQKQTARVIFSTVGSALHRTPSGEVVMRADPQFNSTVYLRRQPPQGFHHQDELHAHLRARFAERGLSAGRERPLYQVADDELYRAQPGEVCVHRSHPGRPIHAESNPCPQGRCLYVFDWEDRRNLLYSSAAPGREAKGGPKVERVLPCTRIPAAAILGLMRVLADASSAAFHRRLEEVAEQLAEQLAAITLPHDNDAGASHDGRAALVRLSEQIVSALEHLRGGEGASATGAGATGTRRTALSASSGAETTLLPGGTWQHRRVGVASGEGDE